FPGNKGENQRMGLRIMNSRAGMIGASLEISPRNGDGTAVVCTLPLFNGAKVTEVDFTTLQAGQGQPGGALSLADAPSRKTWFELKPAWDSVKRNADLPLIPDQGRNGLAESSR
ncbi:MAG TPA: hypothetical protein VFC07_06760, partial [Verrucomicrobiae bacterium]|nr:hypothetical protein [Verrucomicrobiae bacterium]